MRTADRCASGFWQGGCGGEYLPAVPDVLPDMGSLNVKQRVVNVYTPWYRAGWCQWWFRGQSPTNGEKLRATCFH